MYFWITVAFFVGTGFGVFLVGIMAAGRDETAYRAGFSEGLHEGHVSGVKDSQVEYQVEYRKVG